MHLAPWQGVMLEKGQLLGSYRILERINRGSMGIVYVAEHSLIGRRVALKVIADELAKNPQSIELFFREARAANQIQHPNIIQITDLVEASGDQPCFMVMELLEGRSLGEVIDGDERLPQARVAEIGAQIADAMDAAHGVGVIHRDLKPDNVFLCERAGAVKILDFGLAHLGALYPGAGEHAAIACGTPLYMSPEQAGADRVDERADIYSLGALLYEALAGEPVFNHASVRDLMLAHISETPVPLGRRPGLALPMDRELESLVMRCLEKAPENRPASMRLIAEHLSDIASRLAPPAADAVRLALRRREAEDEGELDRLIDSLRAEEGASGEVPLLEMIPVDGAGAELGAEEGDRPETFTLRPLARRRRLSPGRVVAALVLALSVAVVPFRDELASFAVGAAHSLGQPRVDVPAGVAPRAARAEARRIPAPAPAPR